MKKLTRDLTILENGQLGWAVSHSPFSRRGWLKGSAHTKHLCSELYKKWTRKPLVKDCQLVVCTHIMSKVYQKLYSFCVCASILCACDSFFVCVLFNFVCFILFCVFYIPFCVFLFYFVTLFCVLATLFCVFVPRWLRHTRSCRTPLVALPPHEIHPPIDKTTLKPKPPINHSDKKGTAENLDLLIPSRLFVENSYGNNDFFSLGKPHWKSASPRIIMVWQNNSWQNRVDKTQSWQKQSWQNTELTK